MVWARTKLMIHEDLLRPRAKLTLKFTGPNPEKYYHEVPALLESTFRITEHSIQEKVFSWKKGDPEVFVIKWEAAKDLDMYSYYWIEAELSGSSSKGVGSAELKITAALRTEYPQDTFWQKSIVYEFLRMFWHTTFYAHRKNTYMSEGRRMLSQFVHDLKEITRG